MQFKKGTQVQYISGGPIMTMESQDATTGKLTCGWFDDRKLTRAEFDLDTLKEYQGPTFEPEDDEYDGRSRVTGY